MLVLALDTTTRAGSLALARNGALVEVFVGDEGRTHAARLPGDLLDCLARHQLSLSDVDLFAVAAGPGSFTGLRIGIATIQGLAFANARRAVGISALDALAHAAFAERTASRSAPVVGAWMDAQRAEVYTELFGRAEDGTVQVLEPAAVGRPEDVIERWRGVLASSGSRGLAVIGDGAQAYQALLRASGIEGLHVADAVPPLAPFVASLAERAAEQGQAVAPHAIRPLYIRRPDAELSRDRRRAAEEGSGRAPAGDGASRP